MADLDKKINLGISGGEEIMQYMSRLKGEASSYFDSMIKASRNYTTSGKEVLIDLEQQIKLFEKRKRLEIEQREQWLKAERESVKSDKSLSKGTREQVLTEIGSELSGASAQKSGLKSVTAHLRELIEVTKETSKNEIREDRKGVEEVIKKSKTVGVLSPEGDPRELLKETLQRMVLGETSESEDKEGGLFRKGARLAGRGVNATAGIAMSRNEYAALAGLLTAIPIVGQAVAALASKAISAAEGYQRSYSSVIGQTGTNLQGWGFGYADRGISGEEAIGAYGAMSRARGTSTKGGALNYLMMQRGMGLEAGDISGVERMLRGSNETSRGVITGFTGSLERGGMIQQGNYSLVPEYLQILTQIGQEQLNRLGEIDSGVNEKMILGIAKLDDSFKNPDVLRGVVSSLRGGLMDSSSPQVRALQYSTLSRINPNASFFKMQEMREDPTSEYLQGFLSELKDISGGGGEVFFQNIKDVFGLSAKMARKIGEGFESGKMEDVEKLMRGTSGIEKSGVLEGKAKEATSAIEESSKLFANTFAQTGDKLVTKIDEWIDKLDEWIQQDKIKGERDALIQQLEDKRVQDNKDWQMQQKQSVDEWINILK